ncbi:MAG TPA: amidohydrolase family protein [Stellaceae bacterium]|nr:amidohydrolase family protein [Stellaceae bacterium]
MTNTSNEGLQSPRVAADAAWLAKRREDILEPDLPICDPHHHLWDFEEHRYLLPELLSDTGSGHNIVNTVFVECTAMYRADGPKEMQPVGETEFVNGAAAMSASGRYGKTRACAGIVGFADLTLGAAVEPVLRAHMAASGRFRGIRHACAWDASDQIRKSHTIPKAKLLDDLKFREGFARLKPLGLSFDAWLYHPQIPDLTSLARAFPEQPIVLDHVGGPLGIGPYAGRREEVFANWQRDIRQLAKCANVCVKLGGLGMKINGNGFHKGDRPPSSQELAAVWRPYFETCIEMFGVNRCMFESNFPVDKVSGSYALYWNAFKRLAAGASAAEKAALFHDTAVRFYRL